MQGLIAFFEQTDAVGVAVAIALLLMSVASWTLIVWKTVVLRRAIADLARAIPAFWDAPGLPDAQSRLAAMDRERLLRPLVDAALQGEPAGTLAASGQAASQLTRRLRDALQAGLEHLQFGQVLLASVGSTAPFVGLFGTVWGIYHALTAIGISGQASIDKVAGPVGEALIMTAIGLAVAIPAVLGYNWLAKRNKAVMDEVREFSEELNGVLVGSGGQAA